MSFCSRCGQPAHDASFCPRCGAETGATAQPRTRRSGPTVTITALVAGAVVLVAALTAGTMLLLRDGDPDPAPVARTSDEVSPTAPTTSDDSGTSEGSGLTTTEAGPGDVRDLPAGLFCRDLEADGYSYTAAVDYWRDNGQPNQMDEDRNGIPCQTVYSPTDVSAYWGEVEPPGDVTEGVEALPAGLLCRDLQARGYSYPDAVDYWFVWNLPDRMDADLNGIPCETVYPRSEVDAYWG